MAVQAAGVHVIDTSIRRGERRGPFPLPELPMTPGREVAGVVDAAGDGVDDRWIGRRVVAHLGPASGGYAEVAICAMESLHELPDGVDAADAVAMIGTGRTTKGILDAAALTEDDVAIVLSAAGGIGCLVVQAARNAGATVVGAAGGERKVAMVGELGADVVVDYTRSGWADEVRAALDGRKATVLFAGAGGDVAEDALDLLGDSGRVLLYGWDIEAEVLEARGFDAPPVLGQALLQRPGGLRPLETAALDDLESGAWTPIVNPPFALRDAAAAHAALEGRGTVGKVVLVP